MNPLTPYLLWIKIGAVVALLAALAGWHFHAVHAAYGDGHAAAITERAAADLTAVVSRTADNKVLADQQHIFNLDITKAKNEELTPVLAHIDAAPRMRVGTAICGGSTAPAQATSPASGDSTYPSGGLGQPNPGRDSDTQVVREDVDRDLKAFKIAVENDLATGRTCQAFLDRNGLVP